MHKYQKQRNLDKKSDVLVCAKNEADKLEKLVDNITNQKGLLKLIIANDYSNDNTELVLQTLKETHQNLYDFIPSIDISGKKQAIIEGIDRSNAEYIAFTDADCLPLSNHWLEKMLGQIDKQDAVLGYSPMLRKKGLLNAWQRWETSFIGLQYLAMAKLGLAYMGVGRNLLIRKRSIEFLELKDLRASLSGGDDDFLVQYLNRQKININVDPESFVYTNSCTKWSEYIRQKQRHLSASSQYPILIQSILFLFSFSHLVWFLLFVISLFTQPLVAFNLLCVRWFVLYFCQYFNTRKLDVSDLWKWTAVFDIALVFFFVFFTFFFRSNTKW